MVSKKTARSVRTAAPTRSTARAAAALASVTPAPSLQVSFGNAFVASPVQAQKFTASLMTANRPAIERLQQAGELVHAVSASANLERRRSLIAGFRQAKAELALVHQMAMLPEEQAAAFIKDYLDDGGDINAVFQWLGMAGAALRKPRARGARSAITSHWVVPRARGARGLFGDIVDAVGGAISSVGNAIGDAVDSVVNAVVKAGKSLADAIGSAVSWTIAQLTDLVTALLRAGKRVAEILAAAATKGIAQLQKYVQALLDAGRSLAEILSWAVTQVAATANAVVAKLLALGRAVLDVIKAVIALGRSALVTAIRGLLAAGKRLADLMAAMAAQVYTSIKAFVDALLAAGQLVRNLLVEAARLATTACRNVVRALVELGRAVKDLLAEAIAAAGTVLRVIAQALLAVGQSLGQVLQATAALAAASCKLVVQALIAIGHTVSELVQTVVAQAVSVAKAVFTALLALGQKLATLLVALAGRALSALRTALEALLAMGIALAELVGNICVGVAEAFRRGFFEGLIALGKAPLQLLKAAVEFKVSIALLAFGVILEICGGYKPLSSVPGAIDQARRVFGTSIALERVQIGFAKLPGDVIRYVNIELPRAFTTMYLLNFGPGAVVDMQTIIHELAHVWQGVQQGPLYMTRALEAQIGAGVESLFHTGTYDDSASYRVREADLLARGGDLKAFNPEQQATIIEFFWIRRFAGEARPPGPYPWRLNRGVVLPSLDSLLPYAQKVNPALKAPTSLVRRAPTKRAAPARGAKQVRSGRSIRLQES